MWLETEEEILAERKKYEDICNKEIDFFSKIQSLVSEYNKFTEENDLRKFIIFSKVADVYDLPYNWNKDCETYIDDIVEYVSENPNWCSSSARC